TGTITWCPAPEGPRIDLDDVQLIWRNGVYPVRLEPGVAWDVAGLTKIQRKDLKTWGQPPAGPDNQSQLYRRRRGWMQANEPVDLHATLRAVFFNQTQEPSQRNAALQHLDQTWRVKSSEEEVMLVARLKPRQGAAEDVTRDPASPSRLWLGS